MWITNHACASLPNFGGVCVAPLLVSQVTFSFMEVQPAIFLCLNFMHSHVVHKMLFNPLFGELANLPHPCSNLGQLQLWLLPVASNIHVQWSSTPSKNIKLFLSFHCQWTKCSYPRVAKITYIKAAINYQGNRQNTQDQGTRLSVCKVNCCWIFEIISLGKKYNKIGPHFL